MQSERNEAPPHDTSSGVSKLTIGYISGANNKTQLIQFLSEELRKERYREKLTGKNLFVTANNLCFEISSGGFRIREDLKSSQEEADTRMLLHASHAANAGYAVVISSEDTDFLVISLAFKTFIATPMFIKTTKQSRTTYVDVSKVLQVVGGQVCRALP